MQSHGRSEEVLESPLTDVRGSDSSPIPIQNPQSPIQNSPMNAFSILQDRGFFYQSTDVERLRARLAPGQLPVTFYVGFDPTGSSLHIGHLLPVMAMRWLQQCGHRPIAIVGGGTAMVGDPSGKTEARQMLTTDEIDANAAAIKAQLGRFLDFGEGKALMIDNAEWLRNLKYLEFLRDIGRHFSVNQMLAAESVKQRLETGLSFLEFNYMLLQAYDFYILFRDYGCEFQLGGQDQWGNIVAGTGLVRRMLGKEAFAMTFPLLLKSDGQKFGKTASGAVWLDPQRTSRITTTSSGATWMTARSAACSGSLRRCPWTKWRASPPPARTPAPKTAPRKSWPSRRPVSPMAWKRRAKPGSPPGPSSGSPIPRAWSSPAARCATSSPPRPSPTCRPSP